MPAIIDKITNALHSKKTSSHTPVFDSSVVTVIFILGGPGAGIKIVILPLKDAI